MASAFSVVVAIGGKVAASLGSAVGSASRQLAGLNSSLARAQAANLDRRAGYRAQVGDAVALGAALYGMVQPAVAFESAMADVRKVVDFDTPQQFAQMGRDVLELSRRLPVSAEGLAQIVAAGGQSGIAKDDLLAFTEAAAKMSVAFDISAEAAGTGMANLRTSMALSQPQVVLLMDAINTLGNSTAAKEKDILEFTRRLGGLARVSNLAAPQLAAFGAAMISAGAEPERASTSMQHILLTMSAGATATKKQQEAFGALGLSATAMARRMRQDAPGAIMTVLQKISQLSAVKRVPVLKELFGEDGLQALAPLLSNLPDLQKALGLVAREESYAGSMGQEFAVRAETTANNLQLFKNRVSELGINFGSVLLPALNDVLGVLGPQLTKVVELAQAHPRLTRVIMTTTVALIALKVALYGAGYAWTFLKGGALSAGRMVVGTATLMLAPFRLLGGVALLAGRRVLAGFLLMRMGALGPGGLVSGAVTMMGRSLLTLLNPMALVRGALVALRVAFLATGIGAVIALLAAGGVWIYNNWNNVKQAFLGFGEGFMAALGPLRPVVSGIGEAIGGVWTWLTNLLGPIDGAESKFRTFGVEAGKAVGEAVLAVGDLVGAIGGKLSGAWAGMSSAASSAWAGVTSIGQSVVDALGTRWQAVRAGFDQGVIQGITALITNFHPAALITTVLNEIVQAITGINLFESGAKMLDTFVTGIKSRFEAVVAAVREGLAAVREYLPFSDARIGPLSELTRSGAAVLPTFAAGIARVGPAPVTAALGAALGTALVAATPAAAATSAGPGPSLAAPAIAAATTAPVTAGGGVTLNAPISITVAGPANAEDLAARVREELQRLLDEAAARQRGALHD